MPRETFFYPETKRLWELLDETSRRSGVSRGQAFEDFLDMTVATLSGGEMEQQYLATVQKHTKGKKGKRGCDSIAHMFGELVAQSEQTHDDIKDLLGDLFQGAITYGEAGQFLSPMEICRLMAQVTIGDLPEEEAAKNKSVADPCSGSGRMLLAVAEIHRHWEFIGQDVDRRCVQMTAINLALRNLYGYVIWGNSLKNDRRLVYRTGFNLRGVIREVPLDQCPEPVQEAANSVATEPARSASSRDTPTDVSAPAPRKQLRLF